MKKFNKRKGNYSYSHALLCILVLGTVTLSAYLFVSNSILMKEFDKTNQEFLANIIGQVDSVLTSADNAVLSWAVNEPDILEYFETPRTEKLPVVTQYQIKRKLTNAIVEIKAIYGCVSSINLVNMSSEKVLSEAGSIGLEEFKTSLSESIFWYRYNNNQEEESSDFFSRLEAELEEKEAKSVAIIRRYPVLGGKNLGYIVTIIQIDKIKESYYEDLIAEHMHACIQIFNHGKEPFHTLDLRSGEKTLSAGTRTHSYELTSKTTGWVYRYLRETEAFSLKDNTLQKISFTALIVLILLTILIYLIDHTRFFREIANLLRATTAEGVEKKLFAQHNLIKTLENILKVATDRAERLQRTIQNGYPYVSALILNNMITLNCSDDTQSELISQECLKALDIHEGDVRYAVVRINSGDDQCLMKHISKIYSMRGDKNFCSFFSYGMFTLQGQRALFFTFYHDDMKKNEFALDYFLRQIQLYATQNGMELFLQKTPIYSTLEELADNLQESLRRNVCSVFVHAIRCTQTNEEKQGKIGYQPRELEQIIQALRKQNAEEIQQSLGIFLRICQNTLSDPYIFYLIWNELMYKSACIALELGMPITEMEENDPFALCWTSATIEELQQETLKFYSKMLDVKQKKREKSYASEIIRYIDENYCDSDISLGSIGEKFGISESYVSVIIKEKLGISFVEYLTQQRIQRAKDLLLFSELPVGDVGKQIGYPNVHTFIRAFKRIAGTSPGKWKEVHMK